MDYTAPRGTLGRFGIFVTLSSFISLLQTDSALWSIVLRSFWISGCACVIGCCIGIPVGAWLGISPFRGRRLVVALLNTYLAIPSVIIGLLTYLLLSRSGPLGFLGWLFTVPAMIFAQTLLVIPIAAALTRQWISDAEHSHGEQFQAMGAKPLVRAALLALDLRLSFVTTVVACFSRAISEVGAVMLVGGNIDGFTRVMTTTIALETAKGDLPLALALGAVLLSAVLMLNLVLNWLTPHYRQAQISWRHTA